MKILMRIRNIIFSVFVTVFILNFSNLLYADSKTDELEEDFSNLSDIERLINEESEEVKDASSKATTEDGDSEIEKEEDIVLDNEMLGLPSENIEESNEEKSADKAIEEEINEEEWNLEDEAKEDGKVKKTLEVPKENKISSSVKNEITNLEFKMEGPGSRIMISSKKRLEYKEVKNTQMKQIIYFFNNTTVDEKLQRAYDTTEFNSPVALFTLLQIPDEVPPRVKLIIQLREVQEPSVVETERGLVIDFAELKSKDTFFEKNKYSKDSEETFEEENIYLSNRDYVGKRIKKLEVKNTDVQDVLRLIAKTSGYNIVIGDDVTGKVGTLSLEDVPWDQAFALVLQMKKLGYVRQGNVLRVATLATLSSEKAQAAANEKAKIAVEPLKTIMIPISYAKASDLATKAKTLLTERGSIDVDDRTNTIIIKDISRVVEQAQKLFSSLDTQPPRVSVGARFVEVGSSFTRDLGMNLLRFGMNTSGTNLDFGQTFEGGGAAYFTVSSTNFGALTATLNIGESEEKLKTLANPSITVVANQTGNIVESKNYVCPVSEIANGVTTVSYKSISATLNLNVKPIVAGDGTIFLDLKLNNDIPSGINCTNLTTDGRNIDTQVLIDNGDTVVVGSVFKTTLHETLNYVPFLGKIPLLGILFSSNNVTDNKNEIFVFITAKIMNLEESFKRTL